MSESTEYVRKDLYDANMAEIRALYAAGEARHERLTAEIEGRFNTAIAEFNGTVKAIFTRMDAIERAQDRLLSKLGLILGGVTLVIAAAQIVTGLIVAFAN